MLELPDVPRWVEAHGIAGDPDGWRESLGSGFVLGHDAARRQFALAGTDGGDWGWGLTPLFRAHPRV